MQGMSGVKGILSVIPFIPDIPCFAVPCFCLDRTSCIRARAVAVPILWPLQLPFPCPSVPCAPQAARARSGVSRVEPVVLPGPGGDA